MYGNIGILVKTIFLQNRLDVCSVPFEILVDCLAKVDSTALHGPVNVDCGRCRSTTAIVVQMINRIDGRIVFGRYRPNHTGPPES